ncbi:uncharacterized protein LOC122545507, partial [Chiloscyllium plagiosum]|uniref:uncharacterized protein LOC122545507 n=1 Tax=Chiloscyllium plagiosum TaxID=36176 RepID=UPI001CB807DC
MAGLIFSPPLRPTPHPSNTLPPPHPAETLHKPKLYLDQTSGVYCRGDTVTISCSAGKGGPPGRRTFELYREEPQGAPVARVTARRADFRLNATERLVNYRCRYGIRGEEREGEWRWSPFSDAVRVFVTDPTVIPELRKDRPVGVYATGESVRLTCRGSGGNGRFRLYRGPEEEEEEEEAALESPRWYRGDSYTFEVGGLAQLGTQWYSCSYWRWVSGREIYSLRSGPVPVTLI